LDPYKEEILLYIYLFNKKNKGYTVKYIKAVRPIDDRSILSTIRWALLEVLTDSLVREEHYTQFEDLFKTKFKEKKWDL